MYVLRSFINLKMLQT